MAEATFLLPALVAGGTAIAANALAPKPPKPTPPERMPDLNSPEAIEAKRRTIAERQAAGGRESTILTDDSFSNSVLGE